MEERKEAVQAALREDALGTLELAVSLGALWKESSTATVIIIILTGSKPGDH